MKKVLSFISAFLACVTILTSCKKDTVDVVDVPFAADKVSINAGETVNFTIGSGADALAIFTGDVTKDFNKSRLNLVEIKGYTEQQLKDSLFAERIPGLKEYRLFIPNIERVPEDYTISTGSFDLYAGKLVPWDFSNVTNSKYLKISLSGGPQTLTIKAKKAVVPAMLGYNNSQLAALNALITAPNNNFAAFMSFPDGFKPEDTQGKTVRFGLQVVIDGLPGDIIYQDKDVREFLEAFTSSLADVGGAIDKWKARNPTGKIANGLDEIRLIFNADDPLRADDDGDLLDYKGNVYIQEVALGDPANMVRSFDLGAVVPFVYGGTTAKYSYAYKTPGTYTATLVCTYLGRKKYSGDGYETGRPNEVSANEYNYERRLKTIIIVVK